MTDLTCDAIYAALVRGCGRHCLPDPVLLEAQTNAIMSLIDVLAEPELSGTTEFVSAAVTPEELRVKSYDLAITSGKSHDQTNLHEMAAQIEHNIVHGFAKQNVETQTYKIKVDTSEMDELIRGLPCRTEWRREAWNDCKAVMIRVLNKQIEKPRSDSYVLNMKRQQLENVRAFIASFRFDPEMP